MKKLYFIFVFCLVYQYGNTQLAPYFNPSGSAFKVEVGLPATLELAGNRTFRDLVTGIVNVAPYYQYNFFDGFIVGAGATYTLFNVNEFKNTIDLSGNVHIAGLFGKLGYEEFYGDLGVEYGLKLGYTSNFFDTNKCREALGRPFNNEGWMISPNVAFSYLVDENNAFTLGNFSYVFNSFRFNPNAVCVDNFPGFNAGDSKGRTSYFTFGFGYTYYFN